MTLYAAHGPIGSSHGIQPVQSVSPGVAKRLLNPPSTGRLVLPFDALGVDLEQHVHAVPGPLRDLGRWHSRIEPKRHGGVPQLVGHLAERGALLHRGQGVLSSRPPDPGIGLLEIEPRPTPWAT